MIDLGTQPLGHSLSSAEFDADRIDFLVDALNLVELPVVLDVFPRHDSYDQRGAALARGRAGLTEDGVISDGRIHPDVEIWLRILEQPQWFASARLIPRPFTAEASLARICVAENSSGTVVAVKKGDSLVLRASENDPATELLAALGDGDAMEFDGISAPTDLLAEALDASPTDVTSTAARLSRIGVEKGRAFDVATAMSTCSAHAEITSVSVRDGKRTAGAHPVAFFDTRRGRIVATSSTAADGRRWTTLSPGSGWRVTSALAELTARARAS